jgi:hypothetical protein
LQAPLYRLQSRQPRLYRLIACTQLACSGNRQQCIGDIVLALQGKADVTRPAVRPLCTKLPDIAIAADIFGDVISPFTCPATDTCDPTLARPLTP